MNKNEIIKKWNHLWCLDQHHDIWRVVKYARKDSPILRLKFRIDESLAKELIDELKLTQEISGVFRNAFTWR